MVTQTIAFDAPSVSEIGSGTVTAFLFSGTSLVDTIAGITEDGTLKGRYTGTVEDVTPARYRLVVKFNGYTISAQEYYVTVRSLAQTYVAVNLVDDIIAALGTGTQVFGHSYLEAIKRIEVTSGAATLSGAGSGTEVMVSSDGTKTATFTVDASGNVTGVVWT